MSSRRYAYESKGHYGKPVQIRAVMRAAGGRLIAGRGPFAVTENGHQKVSGRSRIVVLRALRRLLGTAGVGDVLRVRNAERVLFVAKRVADAGTKLYDNPFRGISGLVPYRIDMGVDYGGSGPIYAAGPGVITRYVPTGSGWPGGALIVFQFTDGPARGKFMYHAENLTLNPALHVGSKVDSNTVLATLHDAFPHSESGWAQSDGQTLALVTGGYVEGWRTAAGDNASDFYHALGAPPGLTENRVTHGSMPSSYPSNWAAVLK